jgi:vacuolar-type H+-ATPase subunit H
MQESRKTMKQIIEGILEEEQKARDLILKAREESKERRLRAEDEMQKKLARTRDKAQKDSESIIGEAKETAQKERDKELSQSVLDVESVLNSKKQQMQDCVQKLFRMVLGEDVD